MENVPVFSAILIPGAIIKGIQRVSICIELNKNHPQVNPDQRLTHLDDFFEWRSIVSQLPIIATEFIEAAHKGKLLLAGGEVLSAASDQAVPTKDGAKFWNDFLAIPELSEQRTDPTILNNMHKLLKLSPPEKISFKACPVVKNLDNKTSATRKASLMADLNDVNDLSYRIKNHHLLVETTGSLERKLVEGIALAFNTEQMLHRKRFQKMVGCVNEDESNHTKFKSNRERLLKEIDGKMMDQESRNKALTLLNFMVISADIKESPGYIEAAIDKLNNYLPIRRFVGTLLEFEFTVSGVLKELKLQPPMGFTLICNNVDLKLATQITVQEQTGAVLPEGIPEYGDFFKSCLPKLAGKSKVISAEPESLNSNYALAIKQINQDENLRHLKITADQRSKFGTLRLKNVSDLKSRVALQEYQIREEKFQQAAIRLHNTTANLHTKGKELFLTDKRWLALNPNDVERSGKLYEHDLLTGYIIYVKIKEENEVINDWTSLNRIEEHFGKSGDIRKFGKVDLALGIDSMVNSLEADSSSSPSTLKTIGIANGFLFNWNGQTVSAQNSFRSQEEKDIDKKTATAERMNALHQQLQETPVELSSLFVNSKRLLELDWFPYKKEYRGAYLLSRQFIVKSERDSEKPLLKFGKNRTYQFLMVPQFLNGHSPINEEHLRNEQAERRYSECISEEKSFLRHEHIRELVISLYSEIYVTGTKSPKREHLGESTNDLVVRSGKMYSNETCIRCILPPEVPSFQVYNWYDFTKPDKFSKSRQLNSTTLFTYLKRYQSKIESSSVDTGVYAGSINYLPDPVVNGFRADFYYDRACTQRAVDLFQTEYCGFDSGSYTKPKPWKILLTKRGKGKDAFVRKNKRFQVLEIYLPPGRQVFVKLWPTYNAAHAHLSADMFEHMMFASEMDGEMTFNPLHSSPTIISLTHASQRPIFAPSIESMQFMRYKNDSPNSHPSTVTAFANIIFEHLDVWGGLPMVDSQPTGELELYALWNDYSNRKKGPLKSINDKRNPSSSSNGFVFVGRLVFKDLIFSSDPSSFGSRKSLIDEHEISSYSRSCTFEFEPSFDVSYFTPSVFKIRNTSKYISFFENTNEQTEYLANKEEFSLWSEEFSVASEQFDEIIYESRSERIIAKTNYLFNNLKPAAPSIVKIIPMIVKDEKSAESIVEYNFRVRIYLAIDTMDHDRRLGILVSEPKSIYKKLLKEYVSRAGKDMVTSTSTDTLNLPDDLISAAEINYDGRHLEPAYREGFRPVREADIPMESRGTIGLISYTPDYDQHQELWYVDVELNIGNGHENNLHSTFTQLGLVIYQPRSANYGLLNGDLVDNNQAFTDDYRLSSPVKADFFSIRPKRSFKNPMLLFRHRKLGKFSLSGSVRSLYFEENSDTKKRRLKSEFLLCVKESGHRGFNDLVHSRLFEKSYRLGAEEQNIYPDETSRGYHLLLRDMEKMIDSLDTDFEASFNINFKKKIGLNYSVTIYEIECFNDMTIEKVQFLLMDHDPQNIDGVRIVDNYIFEQ